MNVVGKQSIAVEITALQLPISLKALSVNETSVIDSTTVVGTSGGVIV